MVDRTRTTLRATLRRLVHVHGADVVRAEFELVATSGTQRRPAAADLAAAEPRAAGDEGAGGGDQDE